MMRAIACAFLAVMVGFAGAMAQELLVMNSDSLEIRDIDAGFAEVVYSNGVTANSKPGGFELSIHGETFVIRIEVQVDGQKERVTVLPHPGGFIAIPDSADIEDGESVTIKIVPPMF